MLVRIVGAAGQSPWEAFPTLQAAIRFKKDRQLDAGWTISDERPVAFRDPLHDPLLEIGILIQDGLRPIWRATQYDRLLNRETAGMPKADCEGLARETALVVLDLLDYAGHAGWQARYGQFRHDGRETGHAWLRHESGVILDLAGEQFGMQPIMVVEPGSPHRIRYDDACAAVFDVLALRRADWLDRCGSDLVRRIAEIRPEMPAAARDELEPAGP
ncbi:hypothetical protein [Defluviimonas salinarum]|uniref:Uncharacterized protein n=1 Tax=Defluviimonas salinarum TaxID=2992147 RepID=A0ABT3J5K0_9RHOB|nr:hypothetical protein [Defluviimonas salinarum]MCW3782937.1 hypothetical protein [Defluviimonas salinarum]